jgi:uncharacterized membrane protein
MKKRKTYLSLTVILSVFFGIILPLVLGVKDPMLIATTFSMVWVIYAIILLVTVFLIRPGLTIKASRKNGVTVVRYELLNPGKKR